MLKLDLPKEQVYELAKKYRNNGTMCLAIFEYAEKKNKEHSSLDMHGWIATSLITTKESISKAYQYFYDSALSLLESIYDGNSNPMITFDMLQGSVQGFGNESPANEQYYNVLPN